MSDDKSPEDGDEIVENIDDEIPIVDEDGETCLLYTSPSPRD